jgi:hypothetical protein
MGKVRVGLSVLATVLVLASCVARTGGDPDRAPAPGKPLEFPSPASVRELVDPCSLTGPAAYEPHGTARMPGTPDMDSCRVSVATEEGRVFVWVGQHQTTRNLPENRTEVADLGRGATIERFEEQPSGERCEMALVFEGGSAITAVATPADDEKPSEDLLCALTRGAAEGVFNVIAGERVKFWTPRYNSLATLATCEVVSKALVAEQLGLTSVEPTYPPNGHWCEWGEDNGSWAMLRLPVAESPADAGVPEGTPAETIGGRESWVDDGGVICHVYTQHIEFELGTGTFEFAVLTVMKSDACAAARALAGAAWQRLPQS